MTSRSNSAVPLCVDCDGSLILTDLLHESVLLLVKAAPWKLLLLPFWLLKGKAHLKRRIAESVRVDFETLPLNRAVLEEIHKAKAEGRSVVLATATHRHLAEPFALHLGLFDDVLCTDLDNLSGAAKARALVHRYGERGFDYVGNSRADLAVWAYARHAYVVAAGQGLAAAAARVAHSASHVALPAKPLRTYAQALRVHQWLKNLLVFAPVFAAHQLLSAKAMSAAALGFLSFGLCASAVYVVNDLLDLEADRKHVSKRNRPFASGRLPIWQGIVMVPLLLAASAGLAASLPWAFGALLAFYFVCTLLYSVRLKQQVVVDVLMLAGLYTLRVIAGAALIAVVPSFWLLLLSMFLFLSLALVKRFAELRDAVQQRSSHAPGRGYIADDLPVLLTLGAASGLMAVLVLALYIHDPATNSIYPSPLFLWAVPPLLLYWVSRLWMKAHRGEIHDDPVVFAARDWQSLLVVGLSGLAFSMAASTAIPT